MAIHYPYTLVPQTEHYLLSDIGVPKLKHTIYNMMSSTLIKYSKRYLLSYKDSSNNIHHLGNMLNIPTIA